MPAQLSWPEQVRSPVRFGLLGSISVWHHDAGELAPSAPKQCALLALLLLHRNQFLSTHQIIDDLWGTHPPRSAMAAVQMYVSGVRRTLTDAGYLAGPNPRRNPVLQTKSYGYQLLLEGDVLDLDRFRALAAMGREHVTTGDCGTARSLLTEALALWRGPAMADIRMIGGLDHYASTIDEERLSVVHQSIEVELCGQRPHGVVGMLEQLCRTYPMREDLHRLLMTALHQTGRQVEALRVYANARQIMIEEAGVEPGPALRAAQQAIFDGRELSGHIHEPER